MTDADVRYIVETTAERVVRLLQRRGLLEAESEDPLWQDEPLLASLTAASIRGIVATGQRAGQRIRRRLVDPSEYILRLAQTLPYRTPARYEMRRRIARRHVIEH